MRAIVIAVGLLLLSCDPPGGVPVIPEPLCGDTGENNDAPERATLLPLVQAGGFFASFDIPNNLRLCAGDEDWFRVPASELEWPTPHLFIRAQADGAGLCGAGCGDPVLPDAPENTMTIQVLHAPTLELVTEVTSTRGNVWITDDDPRYVDDLLIRISAPAAAEYDYRLHLDMRSELAEDECEC